MKILIFTDGTLIIHPSAKGYSREDIVKQVKSGTDSSIYNWRTYIPIGNSVEKLQKWKSQGAKILYLTSRIKPREVEDIKSVLKKHGFPEGQLLSRAQAGTRRTSGQDLDLTKSFFLLHQHCHEHSQHKEWQDE